MLDAIAAAMITVAGVAFSITIFAPSLTSSRSVLLGLAFLVAGDIIRTVAVDPTLDKVVVLALIVLIRTFLSTALELELEGRWPWARTNAGTASTTTDRKEVRP